MKKPILDLSKTTCHVCGNRMVRDLEKKVERCIHFSCEIRNVVFDIPYKVKMNGEVKLH